MERKANGILRLKIEQGELSSQIEELMVRSDKGDIEIKQGYDGIETALQAKQLSTQAKFRESQSGDEV